MECAFTSPVRTECGMFFMYYMFMLYCFVNCNECDQPNHYLVVISVRTVVMICTVSFCFKCELGLCLPKV